VSFLVNNCVLLAARLAHQGAPNDSYSQSIKLCLEFINADACKEQLIVVDRCMLRQSMNIPVADMLKGKDQSHKPCVQFESAASKRRAKQGDQVQKRGAAGSDKRIERSACRCGRGRLRVG
jgi:hypothetical protein